ncbi:MAG: hypothetical protein ACP5UD_10270, partial [Conexivisphaera sp.]
MTARKLLARLGLNGLDLTLALALPLLMLWNFLFEPGYYSYADVHFPLSTLVPPNPGNFGTNPLVAIGFSRLVLAWPYFLLSWLTSNEALTERIFWYLEFALFTLSAYALASLVISGTIGHRIGRWYGLSALKLLVVLYIISNYATLENLADGGAIADALVTIMIASSAYALATWEDQKRAFYLTSALINASVLLDPDYLTYFLITIFAVQLVSGVVSGRLLPRLKYAALSAVSSSLSVAFVILGLYLASPTTLGLSGSLTLRTYDLPSLQFFSRNIDPFFSFSMLGYSWSLLVHGPPILPLLGN